jgi:oligo-1,6-glucosidase
MADKIREKLSASDCIDNHDNPRMISKISKDLFFRDALAKMLAMMLMTLSGTPFIYQGEDIGMSNSVFENLEDFRDVEALNRYEKYKGIYSEEELMDQLRNGTRDHARVPMQWDASMQAGFTSGEPWIGVNPDYILTNVAENIQNEDSILHFYQKMIELRKHTKALVYGDFIPVKRHMKDRFMYYKVYHGEKYYIELIF